MVKSAGDVLSVDDVDGLGHVQDFGLPVVLPSRFGPEQTFISNFEHHLNKIISISKDSIASKLFSFISLMVLTDHSRKSRSGVIIKLDSWRV